MVACASVITPCLPKTCVSAWPIRLSALIGQRVHRDQQLVGALRQFLRVLVVAGDQAHGAARAVEFSGHALNVGQAGGQGGIFRRQVVQVLQQVPGGSQQARDLGAGIAHQQRTRSAPSSNAGSVGMPLKARSLAPPTRPRSSVKMLELRSQCASLRGTSTTTRALPSLRKLDAAHAPDREAGEGDVHADHHAFRVVGLQHQRLRRFEGAARVHQVQRRAGHQHHHQYQQQGGLEFRVAHGGGFGCSGLSYQ
jgi:hypothetical protein